MAAARDRLPHKLAAALLAFVAVFALLKAFGDHGSAPPLPGIDLGARAGDLPGATTDQRIAALQAEVRAAPDAEGYANLGLEYLQKVRETGDPTFYAKAAGVLHQALRIDPRDFTATSGLVPLALPRHDFRAGFALGQQAHRI